MRNLILEKKWISLGAELTSIGGNMAIDNFGNISEEVRAIRQSVAVSDFSFSSIISFGETEGLDFLDSKLAANILKLRYGKICDTFLADENGNVSAEVFAADIDDKIILVAEKLCGSSLSPLLDSDIAKDMSESYSILSVDGPDAWKVVKNIFGSDIFNLSYLSVEKYEFRNEKVFLLRNGRTGEFGYQIIVPNVLAEEMANVLLLEAKKFGGCACGFRAHAIARMEGNFFNIYAEGKAVKNPLELGLQWMIDFSKRNYSGAEEIMRLRTEGVSRNIVCAKHEKNLIVGTTIFDGSDKIGEIVATEFSSSLNSFISIILMKKSYAQSGFEYSSHPNGNGDIKTISRPVVLAQSLLKGMEES